MELYTEDKTFYPGYKMPLRYTGFEESFNANIGLSTRFRLLFLDQGAGIFRSGEHHFALIAPSLICLNENEELKNRLKKAEELLFSLEKKMNKYYIELEKLRLGSGDGELR